MGKEPLFRILVALRLVDLGQAGEVVGIAVGDQHRVELLALRRLGAGIARREVTGKELVFSTVQDHHLAGGGFQDRPVALLDVDEVDLQHLHLIRGRGHLLRTLSFADSPLEEAELRFRHDAAVVLGDETLELDLQPVLILLDDRYRVTPCQHPQELPVLLAGHRRQVDRYLSLLPH